MDGIGERRRGRGRIAAAPPARRFTAADASQLSICVESAAGRCVFMAPQPRETAERDGHDRRWLFIADT